MELLLVFFICPLIFLLSRYYLSRFQYRVSRAIAVIVFIAFFVSVLLYISTFYLAKHNSFYWGYRSTSWIFLAMTILGAFFFILRPNTINMKPFLVFPFIWTVLSIGLSALLISYVMIDYKRDLVYSDKKYRLERTGWFITPCQLPSLFLRDGIFEKRMSYTENYCLSKSSIDSVKISEIFGDTIKVTFYHHSDWKDLPNPIITKAYKK